jgi:serine/threonine protein kinase
MIFYWAEADLLGYWKRINPKPATDIATLRWLSSQCKGLAEGLAKIHRYETDSGNSLLQRDPRSRRDVRTDRELIQAGATTQTQPRLLFGRHGDTKPTNVLWFRNPEDSNDKGNLKISDFGIAEFNTPNTTKTRQRGVIPNSATYRPPECDLPDRDISSSYDIWTLGCLYLEFITWYFGGWKYVEEFAQRRLAIDEMWVSIPTDTFFVIEKCGETGNPKATIKSSVKEVSPFGASPTSDTNFSSSLRTYTLTPSAPTIFMTS